MLRWPYPTIVQAAGNFWLGGRGRHHPPEDEFVNHKGFNSLALGNHDDTAAAMSGDSVFRNPASTHGDRELPELAANGTGVSANGQTMSGTSFAAPATAGVTALLQDVDGVLCSWPEGCRAILMASAGRNIRGSTWWQDVVEPRRRPRRRRRGRRRVRRRGSPSSAGGATRPALGAAGTSGRSRRA